uniref:Uncharacterized protein n=1 Tax=Panagrolaimus sp. ES5 TaxID=591445 RepID=A0AC34FI00_9BILA
MFAAAYLLGSTGIRFKDRHIQDLQWLPEKVVVKGRIEPTMLAARTELVYQMVPGRMKHLVIINSNFCDFECIQAAVKIGEKYADNVTVITSLLSRLTFALNHLAEFRNAPEDEIVLVVTITPLFSEFVIIRRDRNFKLNIAECRIHKPEECTKIFPEIYETFYPDATILIAQIECRDLADNLKNQFNPENCFVKTFKRWDFFLLWGGLFYAMNDEDFDPNYRIHNFASGIETNIGFYRSQQRHIILQDRTPVPCELSIEGTPHPIKLYYFYEYLQVYEKLVHQRKSASKTMMRTTGSSRQVIGYIDERGVPYAPLPKDTVETPKRESVGYAEPSTSTVVIPKKEDVNPTFKATPKKVSAQSFALVKPAEIEPTNIIKFFFENNVVAIEVYKNGDMERIENPEGNEWTPLYLSMANGAPVLGEKAKSDYQKSPKCVIYDVLKIIGKPLKEILTDPKWGFKLVEEEEILYFEIETPSGGARFTQELVLSAFLKSMKLRAESALNNVVLSEICLSTSFKLSRSQKAVFQKAAIKNNLKIVSFIVTG